MCSNFYFISYIWDIDGIRNMGRFRSDIIDKHLSHSIINSNPTQNVSIHWENWCTCKNILRQFAKFSSIPSVYHINLRYIQYIIFIIYNMRSICMYQLRKNIQKHNRSHFQYTTIHNNNHHMRESSSISNQLYSKYKSIYSLRFTTLSNLFLYYYMIQYWKCCFLRHARTIELLFVYLYIEYLKFNSIASMISRIIYSNIWLFFLVLHFHVLNEKKKYWEEIKILYCRIGNTCLRQIDHSSFIII